MIILECKSPITNIRRKTTNRTWNAALNEDGFGGDRELSSVCINSFDTIEAPCENVQKNHLRILVNSGVIYVIQFSTEDERDKFYQSLLKSEIRDKKINTILDGV
jgi:hypothetical protein